MLAAFVALLIWVLVTNVLIIQRVPGVYQSSSVWMALTMIACWAISVWYTAKLDRLDMEVREADGHVCPNCRYNLRGHENAGRCPECGTGFTSASLRRDWDALFRPSRPGSMLSTYLTYPIIVRRWRKRMGASGMFLAVSIMVASSFRQKFLPGPPWSDVWVLAMPIALGVIIMVYILKQHRLKVEVRKNGCRVCPTCRHNLRGHESGGKCPGCGIPFTMESLRRDWAGLMRAL